MESLLKRATESPLGKSALGVVVILLFALQVTTLAIMVNLYSKSEERNDKRMSNLYGNMGKIADGRNADSINIALILEYMRILPQNRGSMPAGEPPKPVQLKPPSKD